MIPTWPTKIQLKYSACSRYKIACYCSVKEGRPTQVVAEGESRFREFVPAFQFMVPLAPTSSKIEAHLRAYTNNYLTLSAMWSVQTMPPCNDGAYDYSIDSFCKIRETIPSKASPAAVFLLSKATP